MVVVIAVMTNLQTKIEEERKGYRRKKIRGKERKKMIYSWSLGGGKEKENE
jgi:hypothetical protein